MEKKAIYEEIGKTLAPVEIDSDEAMEMFGITKEDLVPLMVGRKRILVYPYPASEEVCREMLRDLRERYGREARDNRCLVAGAYGGLKACPENYSCSACPVGRQDRLPRKISWQALEEAGLEPADRRSNFQPQVDAEMFLEHLENVNPQYARIIVLKINGYSVEDISRTLKLPYHVVWYAGRKIREIAVRYYRDSVT